MVKKLKSRLKHTLGTGPLAMIGAGLAFSFMVVLVKAAGARLPVFQITFFRAAVSALILLSVMLRYGISLRGENQRILIVRALSGFTAMSLNFYALSNIGLADAAILHQTTPFFVMLLSWLVLGEVLHRRLLALTLLSFAGILLVLRPGGEVFNLGGMAALTSAVFAAGAYVSIRHLHKTDSFWTMSFYFMSVASLLSLPPMLVTWQQPTVAEWFMLVGTGVFGTFGQLLMTYAYKHDEASWVAPFAYVGVMFSFTWGILFFGEIPSRYTLLGAALTVAGGIGIVRLKRSIKVPIEPALHEVER